MSEKNVKTPLESAKKVKPESKVEKKVANASIETPVENKAEEVFSKEAIENQVDVLKNTPAEIVEEQQKAFTTETGYSEEEAVEKKTDVAETAVIPTEDVVKPKKKKVLVFEKTISTSERDHYENIIKAQKKTIAILRESVVKLQGDLEKKQTSEE